MKRQEKTSAFYLGWQQLPVGKVAEAREYIMGVCQIKVQQAFYNRMHGRTNLSKVEADEIEAYFKRLGIKNIWGG